MVSHRQLLSAVANSLALSMSVRGESSSAEKPWETTATAGVSFSSGKSENLVLSPGFLSTFRDDDDDAADPSYCITRGVHAGRSVILTDMGGLSFEGGLESTSERMAGIASTKLSFSAAQRLDWQLGDHTYLTREIAYEGFVEDPGQDHLSSYLGLNPFLCENLA